MALPFIAKPLCQNIGGTPEQYSRDLLLWFLGPAGPEYPTPLLVDASVTLVIISRTQNLHLLKKSLVEPTTQRGRKKYEPGIGEQLFHDEPLQEFRVVSVQDVADHGTPPTMATLTVAECWVGVLSSSAGYFAAGSPQDFVRRR